MLNFLRSLNIQFDASEPERIAHYLPTAKSMKLLESLLGLEKERAILVSAPYGSGKSIAGVYALHLLENTSGSREVLKKIASRLPKTTSAELRDWIIGRTRKSKQTSLVLAVSGGQENLEQALIDATCESLKRIGLGKKVFGFRKTCQGNDALKILESVKVLAQREKSLKITQVVILWDEFGRHLERLISQGCAEELDSIQEIAEFASRQLKVPFVFSIFLHQGFARYGRDLPPGSKREWKKIEGRFKQLSYIEDSKEMYRLLAELFSLKHSAKVRPSKASLKNAAQRLLTSGFFATFNQTELAEMLHLAYPLDGAALFALPGISARLGQNERTLFTFLNEVDATRGVSPSAVYDYFSTLMQSDTEVGGAHRLWLETESTLAKVEEGSKEAEVIKSLSVLALSSAGDRFKVSKKALEVSLAFYADECQHADVIESLMARKLLLYRENSGTVSLWHGTDIDIRGRAAAIQEEFSMAFSLPDYLNSSFSLSPVKPIAYNSTRHIRRYFEREYMTSFDLQELLNKDLFRIDRTFLPLDSDGKIVYVIPGEDEDLQSIRTMVSEAVKRGQDGIERLIFVVPNTVRLLRSAALNVFSLRELEKDKQFLSSDPLADAEIQQMLTDALDSLSRELEKVAYPCGLSTWLYKESWNTISSEQELDSFLTKICEEVFPLTPVIRSEVAVRKKTSGTITNSRKKLLLAMLNRYGMERFGIKGDFPDASMFGSVLLRTGLYREDTLGAWRFCDPKEVLDPRVKAVWGEIKDFFTKEKTTGKDCALLVNCLLAPPYGLRAGLLPILVCAGFKAFARTTSLQRGRDFIPDVMPSDIEELCKEPSRFQLKVLHLEKEQTEYLRVICKVFSNVSCTVVEDDLLRKSFDRLKLWLMELPEAAKKTRRLSEFSLAARALIERETDPVSLLLDKLPSAVPDERAWEEFKNEIEEVINGYYEGAKVELRKAFQFSARDTLRESLMAWATAVEPLLLLEEIRNLPIVSTAKNSYSSDDDLVNAISSGLIRSAISKWSDVSLAEYSSELRRVVSQVEQSIIDRDIGDNKEGGEQLKNIYSRQLGGLIDKFRLVANETEIAILINEILRTKDGKFDRSAQQH